MKKIIGSLLHTRVGAAASSAFVRATQYRIFAPRTVRLMQFDLLRLEARRKHGADRDIVPPHPRLHLGCGTRMVPGWHNVDVVGSEYDIDLGSGRLPWKSDSFDTVVSQHVIEHLELHDELLPLLAELRRVIAPGGALWLSCPDMDRACRSYIDHKGQDLIDDRKSRPHGDLGMDGLPSQQFINGQFHQGGEHKNLFDFELLAWALKRAGWESVEHVSESRLLESFPDFPKRGDDYHSLYVRAG